MGGFSFCAVLGACATVTSHENFLNVIQGSVGLSAQRQYFDWNRYPERRGQIRQLSNGNDEYEFFWGSKSNFKKCIVYWEVDRASGRVIGARFEGTKDTCYLVP